MQNEPMTELENMRKEEGALDQSIALNRIVMTLLENNRRSNKFLSIILVISILVNLLVVGIFVMYESQFTTTTTEVIVEQDTGEGYGNNVYQAGEHANYIQEGADTVTDGTTSGPNQNNNPNQEQ